jgi:hypothetical protein
MRLSMGGGPAWARVGAAGVLPHPATQTIITFRQGECRISENHFILRVLIGSPQNAGFQETVALVPLKSIE